MADKNSAATRLFHGVGEGYQKKLTSELKTGTFSAAGGSDKNLFSEIGNAWTKLSKPAEKLVSNIPHTTAADKRDAARLANEQINAYKEQSDLTRNALNEAKEAQNTERRRIEEKQIRGLRNRSRGIAGLMNIQSTDNQTKLGASGGIPSKLGT